MKLGDLNDFQEYIERKSKRDKLDTLLLFSSSSLSIVFTIISAILRYQDLVIFLPILFLSLFMPIYVGYVRGSLILDSAQERARGWIYLIIGSVLYISTVVITMVLPDVVSSFVYLVSFLSVVIFLAILMYFSIFKNIIGNKILDILGQKPTDETDHSFFLTFTSSVFLAFFFVVLITIRETGNDIPIDIVLLLFAFGAIIMERLAMLASISSEKE